jgi:hypothetical protein
MFGGCAKTGTATIVAIRSMAITRDVFPLLMFITVVFFGHAIIGMALYKFCAGYF